MLYDIMAHYHHNMRDFNIVLLQYVKKLMNAKVRLAETADNA